MTDSKRYYGNTFLIALLLSICMVSPSLADEKNTVGTGAATLDNVYQGKVYCPLQYPVASPFSGEIVKKYVQVGEKVKKGDVLVEIALQSKDRVNLEHRIDKKLDILQTTLQVNTLKKIIKKLQGQKKDTQKLLQEGMAASKSVAELDDEIAFQSLKLEQAEKTLAKTKTGLGQQRELISEQLGQKVHNSVPDHLLVKSPADGYVVWENANVRVGGLSGGQLFTIGAMDPMLIRIQMFEADVFNLKIGDTAEVILEFAPKQVRKAVVKAIAWMPLNKGINSPSYYLVELETPNPGLELKEGYKVRVMFPQK